MKKFILFIINKPTTVSVTLVSIFIIGFVSISKLKVDYLPNMEIPIISVKTVYENSAPEEVEKNVTRIIESAISSVNNVKNIKSKSKESESNVEIEFNWGTDLQTAADDIREAIDMIRSELPDDVDNPNISKFSSDASPIMEIAFFGIDNLSALYDLIDSRILTSLEQIEGVAQTEIRGGLKKTIYVDINLIRLNAYFININDIENVVVALKNNIFPVKIRDIANVYEYYDDEAEIVRINGQKAVSVAITKESGANIIQISRDVNKRLETMDLPYGVYYKVLFNSSDTINNSIKNVISTIWQGALFAIIILMIYLWDIKSVIIISISISISVITTFILMYFLDISINIISLSGLVLGVGMMLDNSIVVLENIFIHNKDSNNIIDNIKASVNGASEVSIAITASTLTSVSVFCRFYL